MHDQGFSAKHPAPQLKGGAYRNPSTTVKKKKNSAFDKNKGRCILILQTQGNALKQKKTVFLKLSGGPGERIKKSFYHLTPTMILLFLLKVIMALLSIDFVYKGCFPWLLTAPEL